MTSIWLVRHGETDWNLDGRFQGQADPPLNANGLAQATQLAEQLTGASIDAIYCSDLQRALLTARIIGEKLALLPQVDPRLREISLGEWEGMQKEQIQVIFPAVWNRRKLDPVHVPAPGGENLLQLAKRVWTATDLIAQRYPAGRVLIVSHGVSLACIICRAQHMPLEQAFHFIPDNAHPIQIEWRWIKWKTSHMK
jgi:broad specificity phosphatase PhoE